MQPRADGALDPISGVTGGLFPVSCPQRKPELKSMETGPGWSLPPQKPRHEMETLHGSLTAYYVPDTVRF